MGREQKFFTVNTNELVPFGLGIGHTPMGFMNSFRCYLAPSPLEAARKYLRIGPARGSEYEIRVRGRGRARPVMNDNGLYLYPLDSTRLYAFVSETRLTVRIRTDKDSIEFPHSNNIDALCRYYDLKVRDMVGPPTKHGTFREAEVYLIHHLSGRGDLMLIIYGYLAYNPHVWQELGGKYKGYPALLKELAIYGTDEYHLGENDGSRMVVFKEC